MSLNTKPLSLILAMFVASYGFAVETNMHTLTTWKI